MTSDQQIWQVWAAALQRWGIQREVATLLEAAGPLTVLAAQAVYTGQPLFNLAVPGEYLDALARLLEEPTQAQAFATYLREAPSP